MAIISIPSNLSVNPGASITIPVNINDATGVESVDLTISYNTALVGEDVV
jgi:3-phytase